MGDTDFTFDYIVNELEFAILEQEYPNLHHFKNNTFFIHPLVLCSFTGNNAIFDDILTKIGNKESVLRILTDCEYTIGLTSEFNPKSNIDVDKNLFYNNDGSARSIVVKGNSGIAMAWHCQSNIIKTLLLFDKDIVIKLIETSRSFLIPARMPLLYKANMFMVAAFKKD